MNEIESFLNECANDAYFRVHPEKLHTVRATITKLFRADDRGAARQPALKRIREIAAQKDQTPRQRCKELFPVLLRVAEQEELEDNDKLASTDVQELEMSASPRDFELSVATRSLLETLWILQGRVKALELVTMEVIDEIARLQIDPGSYKEQFATRARMRLTAPVPAEAERTVSERDIALEEFLESL